MDIKLLAENLQYSSQQLAGVKYFTSRVSDSPSKQKRQNTYLEALETTGIEIIYGQYRKQLMKCKTCGNSFYESKEKMTDVNIATHLICDTFKDCFDVAIVVSGDSDLVPPVKMIRQLMPQKEIRIAFPPGRDSNELKKQANGSFIIGRQKLLASQLPDTVQSKYGFLLKRPEEWQ